MPKGVTDGKFVYFGDQLNDKAFNALKRHSPTANAILASIPKEEFMRVEMEAKALREKVERELKANEIKEIVEEKKPKKSKVLSSKSVKKEVKKSVNFDIENIVNINTKINVIFDTFILGNFDILMRRLPNVNLTNVSKKTKYLYLEETTDEILEKYKKEVIVDKETFIEKTTRIRELTMNLDDELESLMNDTGSENTAEQVMKAQIFDLLNKRPDAPSDAQIKAWKEEYGGNGIHVMAFGTDEVYIYHHITRKQWRTIKDLMAKVEGREAEELEEKLKEKVTVSCILYPKLNQNWIENCKAGIIDSLYQMILLNSGFLTPQQAMLLTTQL
jgi:hypothetical protein